MKYLPLIFFSALPLAGIAQPVDVKPPQQKILSSSEGRYVFGQVSEMRKDQYMLDTKTGRLWQIVVGDKERIKLQPVPYIQILGDEAYIPESEEEVNQWRELARQNTLKAIQGSNSSAQNAPQSENQE